MQIPSLSILRLLRCPNIAPSSTRMHRICRPSRSLLSSMASGPPREWLPPLARRFASVRPALNPPLLHFSRLPYGSRNMASSSGMKGEGLGKQYWRHLIPSTNNPTHTTKGIMVSVEKQFSITRGINNEINQSEIEELDGRPANIEEDGSKIADVMYVDDDVSRTTMEVTDGKQDPGAAVKEVTDGEEDAASELSDDEYEGKIYLEDKPPGDHWHIMRGSRHRDGSIYKTRSTFHWKHEFRIMDRNETRFEAMMLSAPRKSCVVKGGTCTRHISQPILQFFTVKLVKAPVVTGSVELYGYIAARDLMDPLLNYIVNISRDDPITVEQGSLIEMTGPKRGINVSWTVLIEYDMRIKTGEQAKDDLQLIDGVSIVDELMTSSGPWTNCIYGECGAIEITRLCIEHAFEATVEVFITEVQSSFSLCLSCFTSGLHEEIRLFDGMIGESRGLRRHVVGVSEDSCMDLEFKVGLGSDCFNEYHCSFKSTNHGCASEQIKMKLASVSVKVTWSSVNLRVN